MPVTTAAVPMPAEARRVLASVLSWLAEDTSPQVGAVLYRWADHLERGGAALDAVPLLGLDAADIAGLNRALHSHRFAHRVVQVCATVAAKPDTVPDVVAIAFALRDVLALLRALVEASTLTPRGKD